MPCPLRGLVAPWILLLAALLVACGDTPPQQPAAGGGPEQETRARVAEVLAAAAQGGAALAPLTRYLGSERELRYAKAASYEGAQVRELDAIAARVRGHAALGAPTFVGAETRERGEQPWVAWTLTFGTGGDARRVLYAFVKVGEHWLLGDIDNLD